MNTIPPAAPPPRRRWLTVTILLLLILCLCCAGSLAFLWTQGDAIVLSICQSSPGLLPQNVCQAAGSPVR